MRQAGGSAALLFVAITAANASNYVFHVGVSRVLGPEDYGALGSVLAILTVLSVPLSAVQASVAKQTAQLGETSTDADSARVWGVAFASALRWGVVLAAAVAVLSPFVTQFLRLDSALTGLLVATYVLPALLLAVTRGAFQGMMSFKHLALISIVPVLIRLGVGIPLVRLGAGVEGATVATVVADGVALMLSLWLLRRRHPLLLEFSAEKSRAFFKEAAPVAAGLGAMWLLIELDLVLARHYLDAHEAGNYAAAGLLARAVLFVPGAVSMIALPHFSAHRGRGQEAYRWLLLSAVAVVGLGTTAAVGLTLLRNTAIGLTFGAEFSDASTLLPLLAFSMIGLGLANLLVFFNVAAGSRAYQLLWPILALEGLLVALNHSSGASIALVVLFVSLVVCIGGMAIARSVALSSPPMSRLPTELAVRASGSTEPAALDISLVVPTYNGGDEVVDHTRSIVSILEGLGRSHELIVVSDGSTDGCDQKIASISDRVSVIHYARRQGKGIALRVGMARAKGKYVAFIDSDGELDPRELNSFLKLVDMYDPELVIGSKRHPLSNVSYPWTRRTMSWLYQRLVHLLFGLNVSDTQTGMKLIRRDVLDSVLPRMLEKRFAFDLEFLVVARRLGFRRFMEAPITLNYSFSSTVDPTAAFRILVDTAAIFYRRYVTRFYDIPEEHFALSEARPPLTATLPAVAEQGLTL